MDADGLFLFNFLFQIPEQFRIEEVLNRDSQTIAEFLDCRNCCAAVPTADDVVDGGLGHTAHATELVDGTIILHREMDRGAKEAGVPRIRIHDIRHSAVSLLIDMGFSATAIADRVGHESIDITYNYAHLFPSKQAEMADKLNMERGN